MTNYPMTNYPIPNDYKKKEVKMAKIKTVALVTAVMGILSIICIIYDYVIFTDTIYTYDGTLPGSWRLVSLGVIPIILFHFLFFVLVIMLFEYLKKQKEIIKEHTRMKEVEAKKIVPEITQKDKDKDFTEFKKEIK
jgi:uncharacterized membrane protein